MVKKLAFLQIALCFFLMSGLFIPAYTQINTKTKLTDDIFVEKIDEGIWRHVSHHEIPGGRFPSNGLIIMSAGQLLLVDTPWNDDKTKILVDWIDAELKPQKISAVITHYHDDRIGGIRELHKRGINTISSSLTADVAKLHGLEVPRETFKEKRRIPVGNRNVELRYPGPGHTKDNIIVWVADRKILFGGCLIKSAQSEDLGNTKDADLAEWPKTVERVYMDFKRARIVVPGHGESSGTEAITRTLELLKRKRF